MLACASRRMRACNGELPLSERPCLKKNVPPNHATACISVRAREHSERAHASEAFEQLDLCCL